MSDPASVILTAKEAVIAGITAIGLISAALISVYWMIRREIVNGRRGHEETLEQAASSIEEAAAAIAPKKLNGFLEDFFRKMPYPAWIKVVEEGTEGGTPRFVMQYINKAYEDWFGITAEEYVGKTDMEVWGLRVGQAYYENDLAIFNNRPATAVVVKEPVTAPVGHDAPTKAGEKVDAEFLKAYLSRNGVQGIVGYVRPDVSFDEWKAKSKDA